MKQKVTAIVILTCIACVSSMPIPQISLPVEMPEERSMFDSKSAGESTTNQAIQETSTFGEILTEEITTKTSFIVQEEQTQKDSTLRDGKVEVTTKFLIIITEEPTDKETEQEASTIAGFIISTEAPIQRVSTDLPIIPTNIQNHEEVTDKNESGSITVSWPVFIGIIISYLVLIIFVLVAAFLSLPMSEPEVKPAKDITIVVIPPDTPVLQSPETVLEVEFPSELLNLLPVEFLDTSMDFIPLAESTVIKRPNELDATYSWVWDTSMFTEDSISSLT